MNKKLLPLLLILLSSCSEKADLIVHNANVYNLNSSLDKSSSFAVKDGKFIYVGNDEILSKYSSANIINAQGLPIYPGFIDSHAHFFDLGYYLNQVDLKNTNSLEEVIERVISFDSENNTEFLIGRGWDQNDWSNKDFPDNLLLNQEFPDKAVVLRRIDGHAYLVNDFALELAGIDNLSNVEGGEFIKKNGKLTGVLIDNAMRLIDDIIPEPTKEQTVKALISAQNLAFENQIKYIQIGTDCVFSGNDGSYTETSFMDATDLYGKSKIVGEIEGTNKSLIRSSIIGPEKSKGFSLMNWFLNNTQQEISGYKNHLWNGVTTLNFAKVVEGFILSNEFNFKTQHLIPKNTITKANLLEEFKKHFNKDIGIKHIDAEEIIDRTLLTINEQVNEKLWKCAGYSSIPTVEENIEELANSEITNKIMKQ